MKTSGYNDIFYSCIKLTLRQTQRAMSRLFFSNLYPYFLVCIIVWCNKALYAQEKGGYLLAGYQSSSVENLITEASAIQYQYPDSALAIARNALSIANRSGNNLNILRALRCVGAVLYNAKQDYAQAKSCFQKALTYIPNLPKDNEHVLRLYECLGNVYLIENAYDSATFFYFKVLDASDKKGIADTSLHHMNVYAGLSIAFSELGKLNECLDYAERFRNLAITKKDTLMFALSYAIPGQAYANKKDKASRDSAIDYTNRAISLYKKITVARYLVVAYYIMGNVLVEENSTDKARKYFDSALVLSKKSGIEDLNLYKGMGVLEYNIGNFGKAIFYFNKVLQSNSKTRLRINELDAYKFLSDIYKRKRHYQKALYYKNRYVQLYDSFMNDKMIHAISELEVKYRTIEKDKKITESNFQLSLAENRINRSNTRIIIFISGGLILAITMIMIFQKQRLLLQRARMGQQKQKLEQLKGTIDSEEKERSRIGRQLHDDIMVELSVVKMGLSALPISHPEIRHTESYQNLVEQLNNTSRKLRQTAHNLMPDVLLEEGLVPAVAYFCNNIKKMTGLQIHFQYYGNIPRLPADSEVNIYRIIQELVQNIIKHAKAQTALVQLNYYEKTLSVTVEDDGIGFETKQGSGGSTMGLVSIQTRIKALNGVIDFHSRTPHGTSVNIALPIESNETA